MSSFRVRHGAALAFVLAVVLAACGGAPGPAANDPAGTVQAAYAAVTSGGIAKMTDYVCAAKKGDIAKAFGGSGLDALTSAGVSANDFLSAMNVKFANLVVTQTAKTDTTATVTVAGDENVTFDSDKMRTVMKTLLTSQGKPTDDATLNLVMNAMTAQLAQTQKVNQTVQLVNEGGKWLICG